MKMKLLVFMMLSFLMIAGCNAQETALPSKMPENITVYFNESGGMRRAYKKVTIDDGMLEFEEVRGGTRTPQTWSAEISREELADLYKTFVENKFDTIKNDERKGIVYDAGSESISISIDKLKSYGVTYGKNSPLSGKNLERYMAVRRALAALVARHQTEETIDSENEQFIQGTWRAGGGDGIRAWFVEWTFDNGDFKQTGYPPITQAGKYRVVSADGDQVTLELYEQKGTFGESNRILQISIDDDEQLTISGTKGFTKIKPKI